MTTYWLDAVDSTQRYLLEGLGTGTLQAPVAVAARRQTDGKGSRGNAWQGFDGNLFFSFALERTRLPQDLKLESSSIYFAFILKDLLRSMGSEVWLKWPNDFYIRKRKIGGTITTLRRDTLVCGIGLNLKNAPEPFGILDIEIERKVLLDAYLERLEKFPRWKQIFRMYALEFDKSRQFETHNDTHKFSLKNAHLCEDGAVECDGQRMYSLR